MSSMPPARPLPDDLIPGILLRLPPDDPAGIIRASAVCKTWHGILTDPSFSGRYRSLHPSSAPPVLGFLHNQSNLHVARFVPTTSFRPLAGVDHRNRHAVDCRHGRVVFFDYGELSSFVVWDPISGDVKHKIPDVPDVLTQPAVVSASAAGDGTGACDHRGCGGGHFVVAFAGVENIYEDDYYDAHACYYASDTGEWSVHINIHLDHGKYHLLGRAAALVGGALYFVGESGFLLRYRYGLLRRLGRRSIFSAGVREADVLSVIEPPALGKKRLRDVIVMAAEGGGVGLASMSRNRRVTLWAREETTTTTSGPAGVGDNGGQWVKSRVIDLKKLVPPGSDPKRGPCLSCVTEDGGVIYVGSEDGVFAVEVKSSQVKKVYETGKVDILPFASFYTESLLVKLASGKLQAPVGNR